MFNKTTGFLHLHWSDHMLPPIFCLLVDAKFPSPVDSGTKKNDTEKINNTRNLNMDLWKTILLDNHSGFQASFSGIWTSGLNRRI